MKISIIIPVYNNLDLTRNCLKSLAGNSFYSNESEVIVVDDGSTDDTMNHFQAFSAAHPWLVYQRNPENLKFAGACNTGARLARGEYLIFLNNDTLVTQNWDKHLLDALQSNREVWIAGAKLLYPDGTLQHAGVYIPELTPQSFGHVYNGFPACFPPANRAKELQCVTAACLMIRREDFFSVGGFDETYANGCEDIDLCFKVIRQGKKVVYQPECEVVHLESMSEGRFDRSTNNAALLYERWKSLVQPDMFKRTGNDLQDCLEEGTIREMRRIQSTAEWLNIKELKLPVLHSDEPGEELFIDIQCRAGEKIATRLIYQTRTGYRNEKVLKTNAFIYKGHNHLLFWLRSGFMGETACLLFENPGPGIEINSITYYSFFNPGKEKAEISVIYNTEDQSLINDLESNSKEYSGDIRICFAAVEDSLDNRKLNGLIGNLESGYVMVLKKGMKVVPEFIVHAVEVMELQPEIGFVYSDIEIIKTDRTKIIGYDFNPETILTKNKPDMAGMFRKTAWEAAGGFDEHLIFYSNTDLFLGILSTRLWKSHHITCRGFHTENATCYPSQEDLPEASRIREKHSKYLQKRIIKLSKG